MRDFKTKLAIGFLALLFTSAVPAQMFNRTPTPKT
jgi:hypothetical protein